MENKFTKEEENIIVERYLSGEKSTTLATEWNCHYVTILNIVKRSGNKTKTKSESHIVYSKDETFFENIDSEAKAYFLGFLYADGCIHSSLPRFSISLQEEDKYILEKFTKEIKYTGELYKRSYEKENVKDQFCLEITSDKIKSDLIKLGCVSKKSLILDFPKIFSDKYINHFIRGYFDGDGSVGYTERLISGNNYKEQFIQIVGSCNFIDGLISELNFINKMTISTVNSGKNKNIQIKNKEDFIKMYEYLYKDANIFLHRKINKFKEIIDLLNNKKFFYNNESINQFDKNLNLIQSWENIDLLCASNLDIRRDCVLKCIRGKQKSTGGYVWKLKQ